MAFDTVTSLVSMYYGNPVLTILLFGLPSAFLSIIIYTTCFSDILDAKDDEEDNGEEGINCFNIILLGFDSILIQILFNQILKDTRNAINVLIIFYFIINCFLVVFCIYFNFLFYFLIKYLRKQ